MKSWNEKSENSMEVQKPQILRFCDVLARGLGNSVGIGVFTLLGLLTYTTGLAIVISICLAALTAILAGLCFAESGVRFLKAETSYVYSYSFNNENVSFIFGWALILEFAAAVASIVKGVLGFIDSLAYNEISKYLERATPLGAGDWFFYFDFISFTITFILFLPLLWKMKDPTTIKNIFTVATMSLLLSIILAGSVKVGTSSISSSETNKKVDGNKGFAPFGYINVLKAAAFAFYGFIGFDTISTSGNEVKKPHKFIPLTILITIFTAFLTYLGVGIVVWMIGLDEDLGKLGAAIPYAFEADWTGFKWIIVVGAIPAFQSSLSGALYTLPKIINSMANDGLLFNFLGKLHKKFETPAAAILAGASLSATAAGFLTFEHLVGLTVIGTFFVSTLLAIDVVLLRYSIENEASGISEDSSYHQNKTEEVSLKEIFIYMIFCKSGDVTTKVTKKVVFINLMLLCASSVGASVITSKLSQYIPDAKVEGLLPLTIFLTISLLTVVLIAFQPKLHLFLPFQVPLLPIVPCLSIFLNIFLSMLLGSIILTFFTIWMILGILPHLLCHWCKYSKGHLGKNSLFEINKLNSIKLNESVWKIKSQKKIFFEGAVNPVFQDDNEGKPNVNSDSDESSKKEVKNINESRKENGIQIKAGERNEVATINEILPTSETVVTKKGNKKDVSQNSVIVEYLPEEMNECVAEIHAEVEYVQGSYEVEIVDQSYNFLSEVIEQLPSEDSSPTNDSNEQTKSTNLNQKTENDKDAYRIEGFLKNSENEEGITSFSEQTNSHKKLSFAEKETVSNDSDIENCKTNSLEETLENSKLNLRKSSTTITPLPTPVLDQRKAPENFEKKPRISKSDLLTAIEQKLNEIQENKNSLRIQNSKEILKRSTSEIVHSQMKYDEISSEKSGKLTTKNSNNMEETDNLISEGYRNAESATKSHSDLRETVYNSTGKVLTAAKRKEELKKLKEFKEKLNLVLKNQFNADGTVKNINLTSGTRKYLNNTTRDSIRYSKAEDIMQRNVKTLSTSEIKNKLEFLLAQGPPKRPSLRDSFNIPLKDSSAKSVDTNLYKKEGTSSGTTNDQSSSTQNK